MPKTQGRHLVAEYGGCDPVVLDDAQALEALLRDAARAARATVVGSLFHSFEPHGKTGLLLIAESHLTIHTWPEAGYAAVDFYTCGDGDLDAAHRVLSEGLRASRFDVRTLDRGEPQRRS